MATKFRLISDKYYNEFRNDDGTGTFPNNLTEYTTFLQGNPGNLVKVVREIELSVTVNELKNLSVQYVATSDVTYGTLVSSSIDWYQEGLYDGATVTVSYDRGATRITGVTIDTISGENNGILRLTKGSLTLTDGKSYTDIVIQLESAPKWLTYKYGLIDVESTNIDFTSILDGAEQAYYARNITTTPTATSMRLIGKNTGSDLTTVLDITFDATVSTYLHTYTLEHTFRIPYYVEGENGNISTGIQPKNRPINVKYCSGFYFGASNNKPIIFEDLGRTSNVGYFGENFNGLLNNYAVNSFAVSNASGTGVIEVTETNTVTFSIESSTAIGFVGGETIILYLSKLPPATQYKNQTDSFDNVWLFDSIRLTEGALAASSTYITNATVTLNGITGDLDVSYDVSFSASVQDTIEPNEGYLTWFTIATENLSNPDTIDLTTVKASVNEYSKDIKDTGLITAQQPTIWPESEFDSGTGYSNFSGYNGDLLGYSNTFTVNVTDSPIVESIEFIVASDNGTDFFKMSSYQFPLGTLYTTNLSGFQKQIVSTFSVLDFNIPSNLDLNRASVFALSPTTGGATQNWNVNIGFQIPWREWIANQNVPTSFVDYAEENNNLNNRTSNYSGVSGYDTKAILRVGLSKVNSTTGKTVITYYDLVSDSSTILDFDDAGGGTFSLSWAYEDQNGDATSDLFTDQDVTITATFAHSLGTLSKLNLFGYMWILPEDGTGQPWFLSTDLDFTDSANPLQPSDTLSTGNTQYVEMESTLNQVKLICQTNSDNLVEGTNYIVYARLYAK